jgi:hypothetical protein
MNRNTHRIVSPADQGHKAALKLCWTEMCLFTAIPLMAQTAGMVEPRAGTWKTWVLSSGSELRLAAPPATATEEVRWLKEFMAQTHPLIPGQIWYWDTGAPPYRWIESTGTIRAKFTVDVRGLLDFAPEPSGMLDEDKQDAVFNHDGTTPSRIYVANISFSTTERKNP